MRIRNVPVRSARRWGPGYSRGFGYFGTASQYQTGKECPVGGSWEAWCDCVFPEGDLRQRCRSKPFPGGLLAPWTEVGAGARGLPKPDSLVASATSTILSIASGLVPGVIQAPVPSPTSTPAVQSNVQTGSAQIQIDTVGTTAAAPKDEGIFGIPKTAALVGGGVLALGIAALALGGKRRR